MAVEPEIATSLLSQPREFVRESIHLVNRCTKPDRKGTCALLPYADFLEFLKVAQAVGVGFFIIGGIGFLVKLIHIPINNLIMSA